MIRVPRLSSLHSAQVLLGAMLFTVVSLLTPTESSSAARPKCFEERATIIGGPNGNTLRGTEHADVIVGGGGNDKIDGRGGKDLICGGEGADKLFGGFASDSLSGGVRGDRIFGERGRDFIKGDEGADLAFGGERTDVLDGGDGPDELNGGAGKDLIEGDSNPAAPDELFGGPGDDILAGELGDDNLFGGAGNDDLNGGTGESTDNCQQEAGTGPVTECEADLAVDVVGPATAAMGTVSYTVTVTNNGPSTIGYTLAVDTDNSNVACPTDTLPESPLAEGPLAPGASRSHDYTVTCTDEDAPGGSLFVEASVSGPADPVPGTPGNESDRQDTTLV